MSDLDIIEELENNPELVAETKSDAVEIAEITENLEGSELGDFEAADIEAVEFLEEVRLDSIIESILFASDRPVSLAAIKLVFKGSNIKSEQVKRAMDRLAVNLAGAERGVTLEEVPGGYQLRTKLDNMHFLTRTLRSRPFRLSGPALEVLAIVAYKQPIVKSEIDSIRGVESGHLLRALMEKNLVVFGEKSELPGKPMQYETSRKFLEIFGLRNLKELPTLSQIDELLPEGIGAEEQEKTTLGELADSLAGQYAGAYSQGEEELMRISEDLVEISATTEFFEQEKLKEKERKAALKAAQKAALSGHSEADSDLDNTDASLSEAVTAGELQLEEELDSSELHESIEANDIAEID